MRQHGRAWSVCLLMVPVLTLGFLTTVSAAEPPAEPAPATASSTTVLGAAVLGESLSCDEPVLSLTSDGLSGVAELRPQPCPNFCIGGASCFTDCECGGSSLGVCRERFGIKECLCK